MRLLTVPLIGVLGLPLVGAAASSTVNPGADSTSRQHLCHGSRPSSTRARETTPSSAPSTGASSGQAGKDRVIGRGGNDLICGGPGRDTLDGNKSQDTIYGGPGKSNPRSQVADRDRYCQHAKQHSQCRFRHPRLQPGTHVPTDQPSEAASQSHRPLRSDRA